MFSCEFCEIFKNTLFYTAPLVAASEVCIEEASINIFWGIAKWQQNCLDFSFPTLNIFWELGNPETYLKPCWPIRSQHTLSLPPENDKGAQVFYRKIFLKNVEKFAGKHLYRGLLSIKLRLTTCNFTPAGLLDYRCLLTGSRDILVPYQISMMELVSKNTFFSQKSSIIDI